MKSETELLAALQYVLEDDGYIPRATSECRKVVRAAIEAWNARPTLGGRASDLQILEWAERHGLNDCITDLRCIFEDARTVDLAPGQEKAG
jgi:hypothetical protein